MTGKYEGASAFEADPWRELEAGCLEHGLWVLPRADDCFSGRPDSRLSSRGGDWRHVPGVAVEQWYTAHFGQDVRVQINDDGWTGSQAAFGESTAGRVSAAGAALILGVGEVQVRSWIDDGTLSVLRADGITEVLSIAAVRDLVARRSGTWDVTPD